MVAAAAAATADSKTQEAAVAARTLAVPKAGMQEAAAEAGTSAVNQLWRAMAGDKWFQGAHAVLRMHVEQLLTSDKACH
jgi:hypothetical protein